MKVIQLLTSCVTDVTDQLRHYLTQCSQIPPHTLENVFYIMRCLETLFSGTALSEAVLRRNIGVLVDVKSKLDDSVLRIYDSHPLLCHYIWHVVVLLGKSLSQIEAK